MFCKKVMGLEIEVDLSGFGKDEDKVRKAIKDNEPDFGGSNQRFVVRDVQDVGNSFEPRLRLEMYVYNEGVLKGKYSQTLVFEKNYEFECAIGGMWIS